MYQCVEPGLGCADIKFLVGKTGVMVTIFYFIRVDIDANDMMSFCKETTGQVGADKTTCAKTEYIQNELPAG